MGKQASDVGMNSTQPLGIAVFGAGYWGKKLCKEYLGIESITGKASLRYIVDSSSAALSEMRREYGFSKTKFSEDYETVLTDPTVNAVHIALPNELHYKVGIISLNAGKHVLLEKPLATKTELAFELVNLAKRKGLVLHVGHIFRFNNAVRTVRQLLAEGRIGKPLYANLIWATFMAPPKGRDIVFDLAPHPIDVLNFLLDDWPIDVNGVGKPFKSTYEDMASINLKFQSGFLAHVYVSWIHHGIKERKIEIVGDDGTIVLDALNQKITIVTGEGESQSIPIFQFGLPIANSTDQSCNRRVDNDRVSADTMNPIGANNTIRAMQSHFIDTITGRCSVDINDGIVGARTVQILEKVVHSMRRTSFDSLDEPGKSPIAIPN